MIKHFGSLKFDRCAQHVMPISPESAGAALLTAIGLLLMVGAAGKSAQIPLYVWLPDAMEGPTPVSALIHAATMVTAGVYMVARSHVIFERAPNGADGGGDHRHTDRVVRGHDRHLPDRHQESAGVFHHLAARLHVYGLRSRRVFSRHLPPDDPCIFQGLLFLAAGSVIHGVGGEQDMRHMGGLRTKIPWTFWTMTAGTFAIAGFPPLAGFFSKDAILWQAYSQPSWELGVLGHRRIHGVSDLVLHVPAVVLDVLRRVSRRGARGERSRPC